MFSTGEDSFSIYSFVEAAGPNRLQTFFGWPTYLKSGGSHSPGSNLIAYRRIKPRNGQPAKVFDRIF